MSTDHQAARKLVNAPDRRWHAQQADPLCMASTCWSDCGADRGVRDVYDLDKADGVSRLTFCRVTVSAGEDPHDGREHLPLAAAVMPGGSDLEYFTTCILGNGAYLSSSFLLSILSTCQIQSRHQRSLKLSFVEESSPHEKTQALPRNIM